MNKTKIAWTDYTWNPITGCSAVSDGCKNCYAKRVHERFHDYPYSEIRLHFERLEEPLRKRKSCKIFVGSMTDLFQDEISFEWLDYIFHIIMRTPWLTYQILTKRPKRLKEYIEYLKKSNYTDGWNDHSSLNTTKEHIPLSSTETGYVKKIEKKFEWEGKDFIKDSIDFMHKGFSNVWFGVTAESQKEAEKRIPILLKTDVKNRFVSIEPMLGEINLRKITCSIKDSKYIINALNGDVFDKRSGFSISDDFKTYDIKRNFINWVIVGGETGAKSKVRKMEPLWAEKIYKDCLRYKVPFFFKQWGAYKPEENFDFVAKQGFLK